MRECVRSGQEGGGGFNLLIRKPKVARDLHVVGGAALITDSLISDHFVPLSWHGAAEKRPTSLIRSRRSALLRSKVGPFRTRSETKILALEKRPRLPSFEIDRRICDWQLVVVLRRPVCSSEQNLRPRIRGHRFLPLVFRRFQLARVR